MPMMDKMLSKDSPVWILKEPLEKMDNVVKIIV
jgi:hypothetical protein